MALWHLVRHGTRYPNTAMQRRMATVLPVLAQEIHFAHGEGRGQAAREGWQIAEMGCISV